MGRRRDGISGAPKGIVSQNRWYMLPSSNWHMFGIFFNPQGGDMFFRIVGRLSTDYTAIGKYFWMQKSS
jgi:hypothetical protein